METVLLEIQIIQIFRFLRRFNLILKSFCLTDFILNILKTICNPLIRMTIIQI